MYKFWCWLFGHTASLIPKSDNLWNAKHTLFCNRCMETRVIDVV